MVGSQNPTFCETCLLFSPWPKSRIAWARRAWLWGVLGRRLSALRICCSGAVRTIGSVGRPEGMPNHDKTVKTSKLNYSTHLANMTLESNYDWFYKDCAPDGATSLATRVSSLLFGGRWVKCY